MDGPERENLRQLLRQATEDELLSLIGRHAHEIEVGDVRAILRNPFASRKVIETLLEIPGLLTSNEVRRELAAHPRTPQVRALSLASGLFWRDLAALTKDLRVSPRVRRAAENQLAARLSGMGVGEKIEIARTVAGRVLKMLTSDASPRVVAALLENPRLTQGDLLPMVSNEASVPRVLELVARDRRWGARYDIRLALCRNPRTPVAVTLELLASIRKPDLRAVAADHRISRSVRQRADLYLGQAG